MIAMTAVYVAGVISGIVLVVIALAGWVRDARKKILDKQAADRKSVV